MRICAVSDLHGQLPVIEPCDVLCIAGDICYGFEPEDVNFAWLDAEFREWLYEIPAREVFAVAGNHDFPMQDNRRLVEKLRLPWHYLEDSGAFIGGVQFWGTPWQPIFGHWAFNATEEEMDRRFRHIPEDVDVLISHGPPFGVGDWMPKSGGGKRHVGSHALLEHVERTEPKHVFCGHIHVAHGTYWRGPTMVHNVAMVNNKYEPVNQPLYIDL